MKLVIACFSGNAGNPAQAPDSARRVAPSRATCRNIAIESVKQALIKRYPVHSIASQFPHEGMSIGSNEFLRAVNRKTIVRRSRRDYERNDNDNMAKARAMRSADRSGAMMFKGSIPALVTPFDDAGAVDEDAFQAHVEWQIEEGSSGLVPVGTTGESPTLSHGEHKRVIELCIEVANGRVPVMAGAGSNSTHEAVDFARHAEQVGADAILVVTPYYNKPGQRGLYDHYAAIAQAVELPIYIYNIPGRSIIDMTPETMARLHKDYPHIVGVKDATGKVERASEQRAACGSEFIQLSGEDATALGFNAHGGVGCISVTANVAPRLCAEFQAATLKGDYVRALGLQDRLMPLHKALFVEPNPGGAKYALSRLGRMRNRQRLPLVPVEKSTEEKLDAALRHAGLLN
jgi:4-hydroxy-tetrahydrodipicolinate synthase